MDRPPRITVLMPVYNAGPFLAEAVDSLLAQTWSDFELLAMDDGSTDGSGGLLDRYAERDPRVRVVHAPHRGLVDTLNDGLDLSRGELIARADAADVNLPRRLERQVQLMDGRPEVGVCGTWAECLGEG